MKKLILTLVLSLLAATPAFAQYYPQPPVVIVQQPILMPQPRCVPIPAAGVTCPR